MGILTGGQTKTRLQVIQEDFSVGMRSNSPEELFIDRYLVSFASGRNLVGLIMNEGLLRESTLKKKNTNKYLLLLGEDITLCFLGAFFANAAEVSIVDCVGNLDTFDVKPGACGNHELLVDTTDGDAVYFVWSCKFQKLTIKSNFKSQMLNICTSDKKKTRLQSLKEHNTLSSMNTSQQNKNGSRLKRLANLGGTMLLGNF